jgi:hypothetical protein
MPGIFDTDNIVKDKTSNNISTFFLAYGAVREDKLFKI